MRKIVALLIALCCCSFAAEAAKDKKAEKEPFPTKVTTDDLEGKNPKFLEDYFIMVTFMQKIQLENGEMTKEPGRVLIFHKGDTNAVAYYQPVADGFVLVGKPAMVKDIDLPREDVNPEQSVPCLIAKRQDGQGAWRFYVVRGKTVMEPFEDDAVAK